MIREVQIVFAERILHPVWHPESATDLEPLPPIRSSMFCVMIGPSPNRVTVGTFISSDRPVRCLHHEYKYHQHCPARSMRVGHFRLFVETLRINLLSVKLLPRRTRYPTSAPGPIQVPECRPVSRTQEEYRSTSRQWQPRRFQLRKAMSRLTISRATPAKNETNIFFTPLPFVCDAGSLLSVIHSSDLGKLKIDEELQMSGLFRVANGARRRSLLIKNKPKNF